MAAEEAAGRDGVDQIQRHANDPLAAAGGAGLAEDSPGVGVLGGQLSLSHPYFARLTGTSSLETVYKAIRAFVVAKMEQNMAHETRANEFAYNVAGMFQPAPDPGNLPFSAQQGGDVSYMNRVGGHVAFPGANNLSPYRMNSVQIAMLSMLKAHFEAIQPLMAQGGVGLVSYEYLAVNSVRGTLDLESRFSIAAHWVTTILTIVSEYVAFLWGVSVKLLNAKLENDAGEVLSHLDSTTKSFRMGGGGGAAQAAASKATGAASALS